MKHMFKVFFCFFYLGRFGCRFPLLLLGAVTLCSCGFVPSFFFDKLQGRQVHHGTFHLLFTQCPKSAELHIISRAPPKAQMKNCSMPKWQESSPSLPENLGAVKRQNADRMIVWQNAWCGALQINRRRPKCAAAASLTDPKWSHHPSSKASGHTHKGSLVALGTW